MIKLFLRIFTRLKRIFQIVFTQVLTQTVADRLARSADTADRRAQPCARLAAQWAGRPTGPESLALCIWAVDPAVDRTREFCSLYLGGRPSGRPRWPNGHISDRWRSAGRTTASLSG